MALNMRHGVFPVRHFVRIITLTTRQLKVVYKHVLAIERLLQYRRCLFSWLELVHQQVR